MAGKKTPGFWLLSRPVTFGSGATEQPRLWTGGEEGEDAWFLWLFVSFCGSAMGSRSSHVALIPDVDQIRRETGCECEGGGGGQRSSVVRGRDRSRVV